MEKKKRSIEALEQVLDRKLTVAEMYANRPRKWLLYLAIVLVIVLLVGWSAKDIRFTGLTVTGTEVAKGVLHGVFSPDTDLLFGTKATDVPYLLLQTIAIAVLGTLFGAVLAIPFAFLASFNIMPKPIAYAVRILILMIRTIPSIVWALMWIRVTGPGAACGVITQSVCSIGMISKMYITAIEDLDTHNFGELGRYGLYAVPENPLRRHSSADCELYLHHNLSLRHQPQGCNDPWYRRCRRYRRFAGAVPEQPPLGDGGRFCVGFDGVGSDHRARLYQDPPKTGARGLTFETLCERPATL